jgi:hypothetical protein
MATKFIWLWPERLTGWIVEAVGEQDGLRSKPMSDPKTSEIDRPMNAPGYMRPRQTVLDEPLDFEARQHVFEIPELELYTEPETVSVKPTVVTEPETVEETPFYEEETQEENLIYADMTAEVILAQAGFTVQDEPAEFVEDPKSDEVSKPAHKKMTGFQRFILFLLVLLVMLVLATVFLYVTDRIELPGSVIVVIEKGLKLIQ